MLNKIIGGMKKKIWGKKVTGESSTTQVPPVPDVIAHRDLTRQIEKIPYWEDKIKYFELFDYNDSSAKWLNRSAQIPTQEGYQAFDKVYPKVHYGCGGNLISGWLNVDLREEEREGYKRVNLLEIHPFQDNSVRFGFSEDVIEHFMQADSIFFLGEIYRSMTPGGVLRLSFPGLEGVLNKHYTPASQKNIRLGEIEAYTIWDHLHFYSKEELTTVAKHLGFREVAFVEYGKSKYPELCNLDTRDKQIGLNTYAELVK